MRFAHDWVLWLLLALLAAAALRWWWGRHLSDRQRGLGTRSPRLIASRSPAAVVLRHVLLWSGLACAVVAAAGPRWGEAETERVGLGANIAVVIDCSRSMLADDLYPDRMEVARRKTLDLVHSAPEHRVALIPFAALPYVRCPLTGDRGAIKRILDDVGPHDFPAEEGLQATAIGEAVQEALQLLADAGDRGRAVLVLSDGSDPDRESVEAAAERARSAGIPVYGLFLGDPEREVSLVIDGREQVMTADRETLVHLAERSGAITVNATLDDADIDVLAEHIRDNLSLLPWKERTRTMQAERYRLALLPAILLVALGAALPTRRRGGVTA